MSTKAAVAWCKEKQIMSKDGETPMYFETSAKEQKEVRKNQTPLIRLCSKLFAAPTQIPMQNSVSNDIFSHFFRCHR